MAPLVSIESNKTNANEVSYEASYKGQLTRKTRLKCKNISTINSSLLNYYVAEGHKHSPTQEMNPRPCSQWYALEFSCWNDSPAQIDTRVHISNIL